jgi:hypothetical protein
MMGSLMGTISEQITNLSVEASQETQSPAIRGGSTDSISSAHPQIAVVGSACPQTDVSTIQWLFPQKFGYERTQESIVLTEKDNSSSGLVLMIVDCRAM